jgi:hypothetical protein
MNRGVLSYLASRDVSSNVCQALQLGTIRGDMAVEVGRNIIHGSDCVENAELEIALWFGEGGLMEWTPTMTPWVRE